MKGVINMATFTLRLKDNEYEKIKTISDEKGRSINKQIEQIVYQYIKDYEKVNGKIDIIETK